MVEVAVCKRRRRPARRKQYGHTKANEIRREPWQAIVVAFRPAKCDHQILSLDESAFAQPVAERCDNARGFPGRTAAEEPDHRHRLLGPRRERPRGRAAEQRYERASPHGAPLLRLRAAHYHAAAEERRFASQQKLRAHVADGSTASVSQCPRRVRLSPNSGAKADKAVRRIRAPTGLMQRSKRCACRCSDLHHGPRPNRTFPALSRSWQRASSSSEPGARDGDLLGVRPGWRAGFTQSPDRPAPVLKPES
jgi:hypothetical protein